MNHLQSIRVKAGLTQKELAIAAGCTQPTISAIEAGSQPSIGLARSIVSALNASPADIACSLDDVFPPAKEQAA